MEERKRRRSKSHKTFAPGEKDALVQDKLSGMTITQLAEKYDCCYSTVLGILRDGRVSDKKVKMEISDTAITGMSSKGYSSYQIAKHFNLSQTYVDDVLYKHSKVKEIVDREAEAKIHSRLTIENIIKFRDTECHIGSKYRVWVEEVSGLYGKLPRVLKVVTVKAKYPYIADTDYGTFQYPDLMLGTPVYN